MNKIIKSVLPVLLFLSLICSCSCDDKDKPNVVVRIVPALKLDATGVNTNSGQTKPIKVNSRTSVNNTIIINGIEYKSEANTIDCKLNDSINISYYYHLDDTTNEWSIKSINSKVFVGDVEKSFDKAAFDMGFTIPNVQAGKYPISCRTHADIYHKDTPKNTDGLDIESLFILNITND